LLKRERRDSSDGYELLIAGLRCRMKSPIRGPVTTVVITAISTRMVKLTPLTSWYCRQTDWLAPSWFNGKVGRIMIYGLPVIVVILVAGWFAVCGKVREIVADRAIAHRIEPEAE